MVDYSVTCIFVQVIEKHYGKAIPDDSLSLEQGAINSKGIFTTRSKKSSNRSRNNRTSRDQRPRRPGSSNTRRLRRLGDSELVHSRRDNQLVVGARRGRIRRASRC